MCGWPGGKYLLSGDKSIVRMVEVDVISKLEALAAKAGSTGGSTDASRILTSVQIFRQQKAALESAQALQLQLEAAVVPFKRKSEPTACASLTCARQPSIAPCAKQTTPGTAPAASAATHGDGIIDLTLSDDDDGDNKRPVQVVPHPPKLASASPQEGGALSAAAAAPTAFKKEEPISASFHGDAAGPSVPPASTRCPDLPEQYARLLGQYRYSGYEALLDTVFLCTGEPMEHLCGSA